MVIIKSLLINQKTAFYLQENEEGKLEKKNTIVFLISPKNLVSYFIRRPIWTKEKRTRRLRNRHRQQFGSEFTIRPGSLIPLPVCTQSHYKRRKLLKEIHPVIQRPKIPNYFR